MTDKLLEGVQYRELKIEFPNWNATADQKYGPWQDVPGNGKGMTFCTSVQFRTKPEYSYTVGTRSYLSIQDALDRVEENITNSDDAFHVNRIKLARPSVGALLKERRVQYSSGANWYDVDENFHGGIFHMTQFRVAPLLSWDIQFGDGRKTQTFHDESELSMFVKDMVDKKQYNFSVSERVKEPTYAW